MATYTSSFNNPYPSGWKDAPSENTPITANALQAHTDALQAIDDYLVANPIPESGGGSGTTNYEELNNLPSIEDVKLKGNVTLAELGTKKQIRISWADYKALSVEEQNDESIVYFVYDYPNTEYTASNIVYDDSLSNIGAENVQSAIETVSNIAKGRNQAHVFNTTADMQDWLSNVDNKGIFSKGDNIYIVEIDVPDWWIAEVLTEEDTETGYYYKIAQLETQKVDLTNYLAKTDVVDNLTSTATDLPLSANQGRALSEMFLNTEYYQLTGDELAEAKTMTVIKSGNVCMLRISSINSDITPNTDFILGTLPKNLRPTFNVLNVVPTNPSGGKFVYFYILSDGTVKVRSKEDVASAGGLYINETYIIGGTLPV